VGVYDNKIDVWSIGVISYMCASGTPPFPLNNPAKTRKLIKEGAYKPMTSAAWKKVDPEFIRLIKAMLVVAPEMRISCKEIIADPWLKKMAA